MSNPHVESEEVTSVTYREMVTSNMLTDKETIPRLKGLQDSQGQKYFDFMKGYMKGEFSSSIIPPKPDQFSDDVLLAPRPPIHWEKERQRHTYYTRLQNGEWKSEAMQRSLGQVITLAQQLFRVPSVIASIITEDDWINQACTTNMDVFVTANREMTLCGHTILRRDYNPMIVLDAAQDWRFSKFPQVVSGVVRFYAGIPLTSRTHNLRKTKSKLHSKRDQEDDNEIGENFGIGTLCVISSEPRTEFTAQDEQNLRYLADFIMSIIDYHLCDAHLREHERRNQIRADFVTLPSDVQLTTTSKFTDIDDLTTRACRVIEDCFYGTGQVVCSFHQTLAMMERVVQGAERDYRESISVPVYESLGKINGYLVVSGTSREQIFDQDDENFLITFANSMTTYLQDMLLVRANKAKTEFLDSMSHEIRTPIHGLTAMTDLLMENEKITPEMMNLLKLMQCSGRAIHTVLSNIFAFRDLESDRIDRGVVEQVNLDNTLQEILDGHASILKPHLELYFRNDLPFESSHMNVNVEMFKSICNRLIENATKFTDIGSITVTLGNVVTNHQNDPEKMHVELLVKDTGRGIGPEFVAKGLFEPFCKEDSFTQGIGLGLTLCEKYAEVMDQAQVTLVTTKPAQGTTFSLQFQVEDTQTGEEDQLGYIDDFERWRRLKTEFNPTIYLDDDRYTQNVTDIQLLYYKAFYEVTSFPVTTRSEEIPTVFAVHLIETRPVEVNIHHTSNSMAEREAIRLAQRYRDGGGCVILITNTQSLLKFTSLTEKYANLYILSAPFGRTRVNEILYRAVSNEYEKCKERKRRDLSRIQRQRELQASPDHIAAFHAKDIFALVVDDNLINLNILSTFMKKRQVRHITAQDGEEAVNLFKEQNGKINLIFMDISMPRLNGIEAVGLIRNYEKEQTSWAPCKIAMLTGLADTQSKEESMQIGASSYHLKPFKLKDIDVILKDWFGS